MKAEREKANLGNSCFNIEETKGIVMTVRSQDCLDTEELASRPQDSPVIQHLEDPHRQDSHSYVDGSSLLFTCDQRFINCTDFKELPLGFTCFPIC